MGTDWHPYLETKQTDGTWQPTWKPIPHPLWWFDQLIERKLDDGSFALMYPKVPKEASTKTKITTNVGNMMFVSEVQDPQEDTLYKVAHRYYSEMPLGEVAETIQENDIEWLWREQSDPRPWREAQEMIRLNQRVPEGWDWYGSERFSGRNYEWFALFGLRTSEDPKLTWTEGIPDDASDILKRTHKRWEGDAHTVGHIMVSDLLAVKGIKSQIPIKWLIKYVEAPETTRLVFWFDN